MPIDYKSIDLQGLYDGTAAGSYATDAKLDLFRTGGTAELIDEIEGLDKRIATFESVLIGSVSAVGKSSGDYPYDRAGLKREYLDEVAALLLRRGYGANGIMGSAKTELNIFQRPFARGDDTTVLQKNATTGYGIFDTLSTSGTLDQDQRLTLLNDEGKLIFKSYATLIDAVFVEALKL